jgi:hypothetical protein
MKFDRVDWKILAFKVEKESFFEHWSAISDDFDCHLWKFFSLQTLNLNFLMLKN